MGNFLFSLNISDILYTFVVAKTDCAKSLNLKEKKFSLCVELPIKAKKKVTGWSHIPHMSVQELEVKKK